MMTIGSIIVSGPKHPTHLTQIISVVFYLDFDILLYQWNARSRYHHLVYSFVEFTTFQQ